MDWVRRQLAVGEEVVAAEALHGGISSDVRRVTTTARELVLRTLAGDWVEREAAVLRSLATTEVPAPELVAVDPGCKLLMTLLPGTDLDVAHCATNLALLHGPAAAQDFYTAYEAAGGVLGDRYYWQVRDALAASEELQVVTRPWRESTRPDLTPAVAEARLDAYLAHVVEEG